MKKWIAIFTMLLCLCTLCGCATADDAAQNGTLRLSFDYNHAGTIASNQFAAWIETANGDFVRTLFVTSFTASGGYQTREDSLSAWVKAAQPDTWSDAETDSISSATPRTGRQEIVWDGTDSDGNPMPHGEYKFFLEATLYWSSNVVYSGSFTLGSSENRDIAISTVYSEDTEENRDMIMNVKAEYTAPSDVSDSGTQRLLGGLSPDEALEYMEHTPDLVIVQVNTAQWKITPGFTGALWIPHDELEERFDEIPVGKPVMLHCGAGVVSVPAYEMLIQKRPDIPELSYIAGSPRAIMEEYNEWLTKGGE
ncbi:MAG: DUF2271 domain-containing protein [Eubacteriales bacterium]|nr:DUF2271 domain-containing protein [Eubacteriales bacterium]